MKMNLNSLPWYVAIVSLALSVGCGSLPKAVDMTPKKIEVTNRSSHPVSVEVVGEPKREGKKMMITNAELAKALRTAVEQSGMFESVNGSVAEGFHLQMTVVGYTPPRPGFNMSVTLSTRWKLTKLPEARVVFEDFLKTTHTSTVGDAFVGATRWRKAHEGAARDAIAEGLQRLSKAPL